MINEIRKLLKNNEFRKRVPRTWRDIQYLIYASAHIQKIIGEFTSGGMVAISLNEVLRKRKDEFGITEEDFFAFFN